MKKMAKSVTASGGGQVGGLKGEPSGQNKWVQRWTRKQQRAMLAQWDHHHYDCMSLALLPFNPAFASSYKYYCLPLLLLRRPLLTWSVVQAGNHIHTNRSGILILKEAHSECKPEREREREEKIWLLSHELICTIIASSQRGTFSHTHKHNILYILRWNVPAPVWCNLFALYSD